MYTVIEWCYSVTGICSLNDMVEGTPPPDLAPLSMITLEIKHLHCVCWAFHLWLLLPGQVIDMFWAVNEETLWEVTKYFSARPQTGTHSGPKIKQSPGLKVPVLLLDVLEDVDEAGELCRCPGHEVGEAPCLVKVNRSPLTSAIICSIDYRNR